MREILMALFVNEFDETKYVCQECFEHNGKGETARCLNEGIFDDRERVYFLSVQKLTHGHTCEMCDKYIC